MQTFLPYSSINKSLEVLDYRRLGKQRVEAKQILNVLLDRTTTTGWRNHPITKMWNGYEPALQLYFNNCVKEWIRRGYKNNMELENITDPIIYPHWFGDYEFHSSHRANLLRKDLLFYSQYDWKENPITPYTWYDTEKNKWYKQQSGSSVREYV